MSKIDRDGLGLERLVFFSDAVFAIAVTLLVLEIRLSPLEPGASGRDLAWALLRLLPKLVGFVVSFLVVGSMWIEHHRIFRYICRYSDGLLWRNLLLLLLVAFMPFPTAAYSENHTLGAALGLYAGSMALAGLGKVWVWSYAAKERRLLSDEARPEVVAEISRRSWATPVTCIVTAILGMAGAPAAYVGFAFIPLVAWALGRWGSSRRRKQAAQ